MIEAATFLGYPSEFQNICLIYPIKVADICSNDFALVQEHLLTLSQEEIEDIYVEQKKDLSGILNPLEYLLNNAFNDKEVEELTKQAFTFFIHEDVTFLYDLKAILVGDVKKIKSVSEFRLIDEKNFFDFQNAIRRAGGKKPVELPNPNEHPRIKAMKAKARYRDKIKAQKGAGINLLTTMASICCMGLGITPLNIGELSYAAVQLLFSTYQEKEKQELDVDSLLAGADSKKIKPKYWVRNLND